MNKVMKALYPKLSDVFDGEPTILPPVPEGAPPEIPRIIIASKSHEWRCEFSPARVNVYWLPTQTAEPTITVSEFLTQATEIFLGYVEHLSPRVARLAVMTTRFAVHEDPGLFLARHFCKKQWDEQPLNRPENFELHAHKRFTLPDGLDVNSWARNKTGRLSRGGEEEPIILFEQDINTLAEGLSEKAFSDAKIRGFFDVIPNQLEQILGLYYPGG
ncbi:MAG: hypothetical protein IID35_05875 [Planctomycetes bacterium]|nr:hypothetical protein [Planctomycetota bacterium]